MERPESRRTGAATIVFDGVCVLCNGWIDFLLRFDRHGRYRFAAMQAPAGRALLAANGLSPDDPASFLLLDEAGAHTDSDAILRVLAGLGGGFRMAGAVRVVPRRWRDALYRMLARNRYRWFGRRSACRLPDPAERHRFIEDQDGVAARPAGPGSQSLPAPAGIRPG